MFRNLSTSDLKAKYQYLLVSPNSLKDRLIHMIDGEIQKARQGKKAGIFLKTNSVTDRELIDKLAEASQAGVPVTMNVRGICCLRPGVPGLTDHIKVFSVVGRYLEHARIYAFGVGEDTKLYIGSADLMTRNTERRVEVACPIWDPAVRRQIRHYISLYCADNEKARLLQPAGGGPHYRDPEPGGEGAQVHGDPFPGGFVQQVHAEDRPGLELQDLEGQHQAPLQTGGVADHDGGVRLSGAEEVPGGLLLGGAGRQRIGPGQVHEPVCPALIVVPPLGGGDRLARPVPRVLAQAGEGVEEGGFPHVGVPRQRDRRAGHPETSPGAASSQIPAASARRRATTAPRKR